MRPVQVYPECGSSTCLQNRDTYIGSTSLHGVIYLKNGKFLKIFISSTNVLTAYVM
jgi:hypothetical protein